MRTRPPPRPRPRATGRNEVAPGAGHRPLRAFLDRSIGRRAPCGVRDCSPPKYSRRALLQPYWVLTDGSSAGSRDDPLVWRARGADLEGLRTSDASEADSLRQPCHGVEVRGNVDGNRLRPCRIGSLVGRNRRRGRPTGPSLREYLHRAASGDPAVATRQRPGGIRRPATGRPGDRATARPPDTRRLGTPRPGDPATPRRHPGAAPRQRPSGHGGNQRQTGGTAAHCAGRQRAAACRPP